MTAQSRKEPQKQKDNKIIKTATSIASPAKVKAPTKAKKSNKGSPAKKRKAPKPLVLLKWEKQLPKKKERLLNLHMIFLFINIYD